jgi:hypothetical protein
MSFVWIPSFATDTTVSYCSIVYLADSDEAKWLSLIWHDHYTSFSRKFFATVNRVNKRVIQKKKKTYCTYWGCDRVFLVKWQAVWRVINHIEKNQWSVRTWAHRHIRYLYVALFIGIHDKVQSNPASRTLHYPCFLFTYYFSSNVIFAIRTQSLICVLHLTYSILLCGLCWTYSALIYWAHCDTFCVLLECALSTL